MLCSGCLQMLHEDHQQSANDILCAISDAMDLHPRWLRFRNSLGEVVTVEKLTVEEEGPVSYTHLTLPTIQRV